VEGGSGQLGVAVRFEGGFRDGTAGYDGLADGEHLTGEGAEMWKLRMLFNFTIAFNDPY